MRRCFGVSMWMLMAAACVTQQPQTTAPPVTPPSATRPQVPAEVPTIPVTPAPDLSSLSGRSIVLDPGHGGSWSGAVAPSNGLREADLNLKVALEAARLLRGAGADVVLTRQDNTVPKPDSLPADLSARSAIGNASGAEVFVSIHHNADIATGSLNNALEVYYKLGDADASLDLGQAMTYELAYRMRREAPSKLLLPGNYKVLRESRLPASLLETSYMTHAGNATLMATGEGVRAEALAIAAGLARYFRLDPPRVADAHLVTAADGLTQQMVAHFSRGAVLDAAATRVLVDGKEAAGQAVAQDTMLRWTFAGPLPNGTRQIEVRVRNAQGAAASFPVEGRVDRAPAHIVIAQRPVAFAGSPDSEVLFEARVEDALGLPVSDGTPVTLSNPASTAEVHDGVARFYLTAGSAGDSLTFRAGSVEAKASLQKGPESYRSLRAVNALTGAPVEHAIVYGPNGALAVTTEAGWAAIPEDVREVSLGCAGYESMSFPLRSSAERIAVEPRFGGALFGKRVVLDAAYGGRNAGAVGPLGTRGSDVALDVARQAAALLRDAGADVLLTRPDDSDPSELRRVQMADEFGAHIVISISFGTPDSSSRALDAQGMQRSAGTAFVGHYPGSANGSRLAAGLARRLAISNVTPSVSYVVQQTSATAVLVQPATVGDTDAENRLREPEPRRATAKAILDAVVEYFAQGRP